MDTETANGIQEKLKQSQAAYSKAMEMIAIFSAATIGFVVALRPQGSEEASIEIKIAIILLFISTITTIFWFFGKGSQYFKIINIMIKKPNEVARAKEPWWARVSRVLALATFISAYYYIFISL